LILPLVCKAIPNFIIESYSGTLVTVKSLEDLDLIVTMQGSDQITSYSLSEYGGELSDVCCSWIVRKSSFAYIAKF
jgi:hypothetical protein